MYEDIKYSFVHYCSTEYGSSGSPILKINNNKIIGIHKKRSQQHNYNIGSFLCYALNEFIDKYKSKYFNMKNNIDNNSNKKQINVVSSLIKYFSSMKGVTKKRTKIMNNINYINSEKKEIKVVKKKQFIHKDNQPIIKSKIKQVINKDIQPVNTKEMEQDKGKKKPK